MAESFQLILRIIAPLLSLWWLWLPVLLGYILITNYQKLKKKEYLASLKWVTLQVYFPRDPHRSPKAMEAVFSALHGIYGPPKPRDARWKGKVPDWFSFEIISNQGKIFYYIRTLESHRNFLESQIYAHYPEAEIYEVPDYVTYLPEKIPDGKFDLWGAELALTKEDAYPIRTYEDFEEKGAGKDDAKRIDPIASLVELLSTLHTDEHIWIQYLFRPAGEDWLKRSQEVIDKLNGKTPKPAGRGIVMSTLSGAVDLIDGLVTPATPPTEKKEEKKPEPKPGAAEAIRAIEKSLGKLGHEVGIRMMYIAPKESFKKAHVAGLTGAFKQFSTQNLNGFKFDKDSVPFATKRLDKWFRKAEVEYKKKTGFFSKFKGRLFTKKPFVLSTEEFATVFHFPDVMVKSPLLPRVEAKHGEPPSNLPVN